MFLQHCRQRPPLHRPHRQAQAARRASLQRARPAVCHRSQRGPDLRQSKGRPGRLLQRRRRRVWRWTATALRRWWIQPAAWRIPTTPKRLWRGPGPAISKSKYPGAGNRAGCAEVAAALAAETLWRVQCHVMGEKEGLSVCRVSAVSLCCIGMCLSIRSIVLYKRKALDIWEGCWEA